MVQAVMHVYAKVHNWFIGAEDASVKGYAGTGFQRLRQAY